MGFTSFLGKVGDFLGITGDGSSSAGGGIPGLWDRYKNGQTNAYNLKQVQETNASNEAIARETNATNKAIAEENLAYQRENLDYQKALQQQIFQREDSAYARTVADMRQAGLSPLAMSGTNGAGEAIATSPLNNEYQAQGWSKQAHQMENAGSVMEFMSGLINLANAKEDIKTKELNNKYLSDTLADRTSAHDIENRLKEADLLYKNYENSEKSLKLAYNKFFGINESMTPEERRAAILTRFFNFDIYDDYDKENGFDDAFRNHNRKFSKNFIGAEIAGGIANFAKHLMK